jgi:MFS family permease
LNLGFLTKEVKINSRKMLSVTILSSTSLAWSFFMVFSFESIFKDFTGDPTWAYLGEALFFGFGALSAVIGAALSNKVDRRNLLLVYITLGVLATASIAVSTGTIFFLLSSMLLGLSLCLGFPSLTAFLAESTVVEERARVSGIVILITFFLVVFGVVATTISSYLLVVVLMGVLLRSSSYLALVLDPYKKEQVKQKSWRNVLASRNFLLYMFPYIMFNIAAGLTIFIYTNPSAEYADAITLGNALHYLGTGIFAFVAGFVGDRFGRKQPIIFGMVILGSSFALLGFESSPLSVIISLAVSGIAWGFLIVTYLTIPGDLGFQGSKEKFYALEIIITLIIGLGFTVISEFGGVHSQPNVLSGVLSLILFLSIIPVLRAKEILSEKKLYERRMREHIDKVGKLVQESKKT